MHPPGWGTLNVKPIEKKQECITVVTLEGFGIVLYLNPS